MLHAFMKILAVEISLLLEGLISILILLIFLILLIKAKSQFVIFSSHIKDDKEKNENTGATMTFTQKITCN